MSTNPTEQFCGAWTPPEVLFLYQQGQITATEVMFLSTVQSLSPPGGRGCYATNRFLCSKVRVKVRQLQYILAKLEEMGLISISLYQGKRYIQVTWGLNNRSLGVQSTAWGGAVECTPRSSVSLRSKETDSLENKNENTAPPPKSTEMKASFFPEKLPPPKYTEFDLAQAKRLHAIVTEVRQRRSKWSKDRWSNEIRLLREELTANAEERISKAIDWYAANNKRKGVPSIDSGASFRRCFDWLEDLIEKDTSFQVEVSPEAKEITKRIIGLGWPKGSKDQVETVVQLSINRFTILRQKIKQLIKESESTTDSRFLAFVNKRMGHESYFVENWMRAVHKKVAKWKDWNGDLHPFAFDPRSKQFDSMGREWSIMFANNTQLWTKLKGELV